MTPVLSAQKNAGIFRKAARKLSKGQTTAKQKEEGLVLVIDHPEAKEVITSSDYVIRCGASEGYRVDISIDGYEWRPARWSVGFWWFDWSGYPVGRHRIYARLVGEGEKEVKKVVRQVDCRF